MAGNEKSGSVWDDPSWGAGGSESQPDPLDLTAIPGYVKLPPQVVIVDTPETRPPSGWD